MLSMTPNRRSKRRTLNQATVILDDDVTSGVAIQALMSVGRMHFQAGPTDLLVDLTKASAADTKIVAALIELQILAVRSGGRLRVQVSAPVHNWLKVCKVEWLSRGVRASKLSQFGSIRRLSHR